MNIPVYNIALVAHIIGITLMAGATFIDFMIFKLFWKVYPSDKAKGMVIGDTLYTLQRFMGIGMLVILVSGVAMMVYLHQVWGQQIWFRVKMGMLVLIIVNGFGVRGRTGSTLKKLLAEGSSPNFEAKLSNLKRKLTLAQPFQLLFFLIIFILSVFKFN
jgi:hypothetical protein